MTTTSARTLAAACVAVTFASGLLPPLRRRVCRDNGPGRPPCSRATRTTQERWVLSTIPCSMQPGCAMPISTACIPAMKPAPRPTTWSSAATAIGGCRRRPTPGNPAASGHLAAPPAAMSCRPRAPCARSGKWNIGSAWRREAHLVEMSRVSVSRRAGASATPAMTAKALMKEGGIIACEAGRHPLPPMEPDTRRLLIETARRLDAMVLRHGR